MNIFIPIFIIAILCIAVGILLGINYANRKARDDSRRHVSDRLKSRSGRQSNVPFIHGPHLG